MKNVSPLTIRALRKIVTDSHEFESVVEDIRERYNIELTNAFRRTELYTALKSDDRAAQLISPESQDKRSCFLKEIKILCTDFFLKNFMQDIKSYVLTGYMPIIHDRTRIRLENRQLSIITDLDITKTEWGTVWKKIAHIKNQEYAENMHGGISPKKHEPKAHEYLDSILWMQRKKYMPAKTMPKRHMDKLKRMDHSQKQKWRKEGREIIKALQGDL
jgi:hypothetical protein